MAQLAGVTSTQVGNGRRWVRHRTYLGGVRGGGAEVWQGEAKAAAIQTQTRGHLPVPLWVSPDPEPRPEASPGPSTPDHPPGRGEGVSVSQPSCSRQWPQETLTGLCCAGLNSGGEDAHPHLGAGSQLEAVQCVRLQVL